MSATDSHALVLGLCFGSFLSGFFFASLAVSVRIALHATRPALVLLLFSGCRLLLFMAAGYWVVRAYGGLWCLVGFVPGFYLMRLLVTSLIPTTVLVNARTEEVA